MSEVLCPLPGCRDSLSIETRHVRLFTHVHPLYDGGIYMSRATGWQAGLELYDEDGVSDEQSHHLWEETVYVIIINIDTEGHLK